jgi:hypothetical protein
MAEEFITTFRDEHSELRDVLLSLAEAFENNDSEGALEAIEEMAALAGPHFHYEQEALYPALAEVHGDEQIEQLLEQHSQAVEAACQLAELAEREGLDEQAAAYGADLVRQLLPHVAEPDEIAVMVEVLEPQTIKKLHKAHKESKKKGATLADLAKTTRKKTPKKKVVAKAAKPVRSAAPKRTAKSPRPTASKLSPRESSAAAKRRHK